VINKFGAKLSERDTHSAKKEIKKEAGAALEVVIYE